MVVHCILAKRESTKKMLSVSIFSFSIYIHSFPCCLPQVPQSILQELLSGFVTTKASWLIWNWTDLKDGLKMCPDGSTEEPRPEQSVISAVVSQTNLFTHSKSGHHHLCNLGGTVKVTGCTWGQSIKTQKIFLFFHVFHIHAVTVLSNTLHTGTLSYQLWCSPGQRWSLLPHDRPCWHPSGPEAASESRSSGRSLGAWTPGGGERLCEERQQIPPWRSVCGALTCPRLGPRGMMVALLMGMASLV